MLALILNTIIIAQIYAIEFNYINVINYSNASDSWGLRKMSTNIPVYTFNITDNNDDNNDDNTYYREDKYDWIIYTI
jgi:hypothetical protein